MKIRNIVRRANAFTLAAVFSVSTLLAVALPSMVYAAGPFTCTWTGGGTDSNFSTAANWSGCNSAAPQPADGDALIFDDTTATNVSPVNDLVGANFSSITFQGDGTNGSFDISGTAFNLSGNITVASGGDFTDIENNITV